MAIITKAFFVQRPRTITDLIIPDSNVTEARFKIVEIVLLKSIDYENFITDMLTSNISRSISPNCQHRKRSRLSSSEYSLTRTSSPSSSERVI